MSRFVRRIAGKVAGHYSVPQPGEAEEELPDDHPDLVAYDNPPLPPPTAIELRAGAFDADPETLDLATRARTAMPGQIDAWLLTKSPTELRTVVGALIKRLIAKGLL